jgi:hypothetical protein
MMGESKRQQSDGEEQEADKWWGRSRDTRVMEKRERVRQASDGEEREAGE